MKIDHSYHNVFFICEKVTGSAERKSVKGTQIFDKMEKTTPKASNIFAPLPVSIKKSGKKVKQKKKKRFRDKPHEFKVSGRWDFPLNFSFGLVFLILINLV